MNNYTIITSVQPSSEPVTAQEVFDHLGFNGSVTPVQDMLNGFVSTARMMFEEWTGGRIVLPTTFIQYFEDWPCGGGPIPLAKANVSALTSVKYFDTSNVEQDLSGCSLDATGTPALVFRASTSSYPQLSPDKPRPIAVTFVAGWTNTDAVPKDVVQAIKMLAGHLYTIRESHRVEDFREVAMGFGAICNKYKTGLGRM